MRQRKVWWRIVVGVVISMTLVMSGCQRTTDATGETVEGVGLARQRLKGWPSQEAYDMAQSLKYRTIFAECQVAEQVQAEMAEDERSERLSWFTKAALVYQQLETTAAMALKIPAQDTKSLLDARLQVYRAQFDAPNPAADIERHEHLVKQCDDWLRLDPVAHQQLSRLSIADPEPEGVFVGLFPEASTWTLRSHDNLGTMLDRELDCMAKVVIHEANNQSQRGRVAVAMVMRNRLQSGKFGRSYCAVARQNGQFFDVDRYAPERHTVYWWLAMRAARDVFYGKPDVTGGAEFYKSADVPDDGFFRGLRFTIQIEDHRFYR